LALGVFAVGFAADGGGDGDGGGGDDGGDGGETAREGHK
jgi:hypothetical protein